VDGVGELFGISKWITVPTTTAFLIGLAFTGSYKRAERIGIAIGLAELAFVPAMILSHPNVHQPVTGLGTSPWHNSQYVYLLAANVGAVIMPWMIFYQQSAVVQRKLKTTMQRQARIDPVRGDLGVHRHDVLRPLHDSQHPRTVGAE